MRVIAQVVDAKADFKEVDGNVKMPVGEVTDTLWHQGGVSSDLKRLADKTTPSDVVRLNPGKVLAERAQPFETFEKTIRPAYNEITQAIDELILSLQLIRTDLQRSYDTVELSFGTSLPEVLRTFETFEKTAAKPLTDDTAPSDVFVLSGLKILSELAQQSDVLEKALSGPIDDASSAIDEIALGIAPTLDDLTRSTDSIAKTIWCVISDALRLEDTLETYRSRAYQEDGTMTDSVALMFSRPIVETIGSVDSLVATWHNYLPPDYTTELYVGETRNA